MSKYKPDQIVDDLVYVNSDDSPALEVFDDPALATDALDYADPATRTKS